VISVASGVKVLVWLIMGKSLSKFVGLSATASVEVDSSTANSAQSGLLGGRVPIASFYHVLRRKNSRRDETIYKEYAPELLDSKHWTRRGEGGFGGPVKAAP